MAKDPAEEAANRQVQQYVLDKNNSRVKSNALTTREGSVSLKKGIDTLNTKFNDNAEAGSTDFVNQALTLQKQKNEISSALEEWASDSRMVTHDEDYPNWYDVTYSIQEGESKSRLESWKVSLAPADLSGDYGDKLTTLNKKSLNRLQGSLTSKVEGVEDRYELATDSENKLNKIKKQNIGIDYAKKIREQEYKVTLANANAQATKTWEESRVKQEKEKINSENDAKDKKLQEEYDKKAARITAKYAGGDTSAMSEKDRKKLADLEKEYEGKKADLILETANQIAKLEEDSKKTCGDAQAKADAVKAKADKKIKSLEAEEEKAQKKQDEAHNDEIDRLNNKQAKDIKALEKAALKQELEIKASVMETVYNEYVAAKEKENAALIEQAKKDGTDVDKKSLEILSAKEFAIAAENDKAKGKKLYNEYCDQLFAKSFSASYEASKKSFDKNYEEITASASIDTTDFNEDLKEWYTQAETDYKAALKKSQKHTASEKAKTIVAWSTLGVDKVLGGAIANWGATVFNADAGEAWKTAMIAWEGESLGYANDTAKDIVKDLTGGLLEFDEWSDLANGDTWVNAASNLTSAIVNKLTTKNYKDKVWGQISSSVTSASSTFGSSDAAKASDGSSKEYGQATIIDIPGSAKNAENVQEVNDMLVINQNPTYGKSASDWDKVYLNSAGASQYFKFGKGFYRARLKVGTDGKIVKNTTEIGLHTRDKKEGTAGSIGPYSSDTLYSKTTHTMWNGIFLTSSGAVSYLANGKGFVRSRGTKDEGSNIVSRKWESGTALSGKGSTLNALSESDVSTKMGVDGSDSKNPQSELNAILSAQPLAFITNCSIKSPKDIRKLYNEEEVKWATKFFLDKKDKRVIVSSDGRATLNDADHSLVFSKSKNQITTALSSIITSPDFQMHYYLAYFTTKVEGGNEIVYTGAAGSGLFYIDKISVGTMSPSEVIKVNYGDSVLSLRSQQASKGNSKVSWEMREDAYINFRNILEKKSGAGITHTHMGVDDKDVVGREVLSLHIIMPIGVQESSGKKTFKAGHITSEDLRIIKIPGIKLTQESKQLTTKIEASCLKSLMTIDEWSI